MRQNGICTNESVKYAQQLAAGKELYKTMINIIDISIDKIIGGEFQREMPELYDLKNTFENNRWHHETTFEHTMSVLSEYEKIISTKQIDWLDVKINNNSKKSLLRIAILLHDISKNDTMLIANDKNNSFPNHEEKGAIKAKNILQKFELSEDEKEFIISIIENHGHPHEILRNREECEQALDDLKIKIPDIYNETILLAMVDTMGSKLELSSKEEYDFRISKYKNVLGLM